VLTVRQRDGMEPIEEREGDRDGGGRERFSSWNLATLDSVRGVMMPGVWFSPLFGVAILTATSSSVRALGGVLGLALASATLEAQNCFRFRCRSCLSRHLERCASVSLLASFFRGRPGRGSSSPSLIL
jgi:hypothetical protein